MFFYNTDTEIANIVHMACGDNPNFFVATHHGVDFIFHSSDYGDFLVVLQ